MPNPVLTKMLDRLFASLINGPAMNCRPHRSRQRIDLSTIDRLQDRSGDDVLAAILGESSAIKLAARAEAPVGRLKGKGDSSATSSGDKPDPGQLLDRLDDLQDDSETDRRWSEQQAILTKLRVMADDARTYGRDTGVHALNIGFPLLSLPPGTFGGRGGPTSRRILAPLAFVPINLSIKSGVRPTVEIRCHAAGDDLLVPNTALFAWIEQQTGHPMPAANVDEKLQPWSELKSIVRAVAERLELAVPPVFSGDGMPEMFSLAAVSRSDDADASAILVSAVLGLFPASNQGLLNDTKAMIETAPPTGPVESFIRRGLSFDRLAVPQDQPQRIESTLLGVRDHSVERLITHADPCQARAVRLAREPGALVIHGPPGTGKSQTIANVIGDHLAHGERVLFVCDKRTALDVVADRLGALGLTDLLATVHDPQRDQKEFYRAVREQLDQLVERPEGPAVDEKLAALDGRLQATHDELFRHHTDLMSGGDDSFHQLMGRWLADDGPEIAGVEPAPLATLGLPKFYAARDLLKDVLHRGESVDYWNNIWRSAAGLPLDRFLAAPMDQFRKSVDRIVATADAADTAIDPQHPPFALEDDLPAEANRRAVAAGQLAALASVVAETTVKVLPKPADGLLTRLREQINRFDESLSAPPDPMLWNSAAAVGDPGRFVPDRAVLLNYITGFEALARRLNQLRAVATAADDEIRLAWIAADPADLANARRRLDAVDGLSRQVETAVVDPTLRARFESTPLDSDRLVAALASLNSYLDVAGSWKAMFAGGVKKSAEPALRPFGLSLNAESAERVREFLNAVQNRRDLVATIESVTGAKLDAPFDDFRVITAYKMHRAVVTAMTTTVAADAAVTDLNPAEIGRLNEKLPTTAPPAAAVLSRFGLALTPTSAAALSSLLDRLDARTVLLETVNRVMSPTVKADIADKDLLAQADIVKRLVEIITDHPAATPVGKSLIRALTDPSVLHGTVEALRQSPARAVAIIGLNEAIEHADLFAEPFASEVEASLRSNGAFAETARTLLQQLPMLEGVLRTTDGLAKLPAELSTAAAAALTNGATAAIGYQAIHRQVIGGEIRRRLQATPGLHEHDATSLQALFDRYRTLSSQKKSLVLDRIKHHWVGRQRQRLLATTGTRLNSVASDLRRRLTSRGERAMRLRQVIAHGAALEGGDPLFDLRPVWMASPETVAQLFPREPIFDVVIFDEASQCRLEEALPVLTRAKRVVIAGDPKQLPPTRFFESAVVRSDDDDPQTDDDIFTQEQGEIEDLLTASLGLDVRQCYLDVHYRSRNADLIGFSNLQFYQSRLQAIPGHPRNRAKQTPISLHRVDGPYERRQNAVEADHVVALVKELLDRPAPPSIGIACFNMVQRDLVLDRLEAAADEDADFAKKLADARDRRGPNSSEGLFVKNLENVQGDERDHLIISTTYGPDSTGKFRKTFGPLGTAGGGRRLNVLITRAREHLHVVTSIPRSSYAALPAVPAGLSPTGSYLLFAYLAHVEALATEYEMNERIVASARDAGHVSSYIKPTAFRSKFAIALGERLATEHAIGNDVHWGNDGFAIDLALLDSDRPEDVTVGILTDMTRYAGSDDPVEWDVFRTGIHEQQGWQLHRLWTPHFFRDAEGGIAEIIAAAANAKT